MLLTAVFVSQPSVGLTAPLPRYHRSSPTAAVADSFTGQLSPVMSPLNTSTATVSCIFCLSWWNSSLSRAAS